MKPIIFENWKCTSSSMDSITYRLNCTRKLSNGTYKFKGYITGYVNYGSYLCHIEVNGPNGYKKVWGVEKNYLCSARCWAEKILSVDFPRSLEN